MPIDLVYSTTPSDKLKDLPPGYVANCVQTHFIRLVFIFLTLPGPQLHVSPRFILRLATLHRLSA